jgi:hypothetical protein
MLKIIDKCPQIASVSTSTEIKSGTFVEIININKFPPEIKAGRNNGIPGGVILHDVENLKGNEENVNVSFLSEGTILTDQFSGRGWDTTLSCLFKPVYYDNDGKFTLKEIGISVGVCVRPKDNNGLVMIRLG